MNQLSAILGLAVFLGLSYAVSNNRKAIKWRTVGWGLALQLLFALAILKTKPGYVVFRACSDAINKMISFTDSGASFVWGWIYGKWIKDGSPPIFFVDILMTIIFFSALMSLLYHIGVMQWIVARIAWVMRKTMGTSGSETLSASANIFVGQTEAPLVVKPFVETMTMSELHAIMVGGFATVAGGVMAAYVTFGVDAGHLLAASFMSAPAALVMAKMWYPETQESVTAGELKIKLEKQSANVFDAVCVGAGDGMKLVLNVAAMLLAFICIITMLNWCVSEAHQLVRVELLNMERTADPVTFEKVFGWLFAPIAWLLGVPWKDCPEVGQLLGTRMVINEFVAYMKLPEMDISPRSYIIATYAFCGFANFSSIAIQIGGISALAPSRRSDLARLGFRAMLAATLASFLTANIAGALLSDEEMERDYRRNRGRTEKTLEGKLKHYDAFLNQYPSSEYAPDFQKLRQEAIEKAPK